MLRKKLRYNGRTKTPLLYAGLLVPWLVKGMDRKLGLGIKGDSMTLDGHWFFLQNDWKLVKDRTLDALGMGHDSFFSNFFSECERTIRETLEATVGLDRDTSKSSYLSFLDNVRKLQFPWIITLPMAEALEHHIIESMGNGSAGLLEQFFIPHKPLHMTRQKAGAEKIKDKLAGHKLYDSYEEGLSSIIIKDRALHDEIMAHIDEFRWVGMMHFWGDPFSAEKFFVQLETLKKGNRPTGTATVPNRMIKLKELSARMAYYRNSFAETCAIASHSWHKNLGAAEKLTGIQRHDINWLTYLEFLSLLDKKSIHDPEYLDKRKQSYGIMSASDEVFTGKALKSMLGKVLSSTFDASSVSGMVACRGKVRGTARIIHDPKEIGLMSKGEILIVSETTPEYMPAIFKAKAIVADNGGMASHSAIVSREYNIPCIVGAGHATRVFKDGDMVEVDADRGIVKKIK